MLNRKISMSTYFYIFFSNIFFKGVTIHFQRSFWAPKNFILVQEMTSIFKASSPSADTADFMIWSKLNPFQFGAIERYDDVLGRVGQLWYSTWGLKKIRSKNIFSSWFFLTLEMSNFHFWRIFQILLDFTTFWTSFWKSTYLRMHITLIKKKLRNRSASMSS